VDGGRVVVGSFHRSRNLDPKYANGDVTIDTVTLDTTKVAWMGGSLNSSHRNFVAILLNLFTFAGYLPVDPPKVTCLPGTSQVHTQYGDV
jgi:hypothetical protein